MKHLIRLMFLAAAGGCFLVARAASPAPITVAFDGDSIVASWNLSTSFPGITTINDGYSGQATAFMLSHYAADVIARHPTIVVLMGGINDLPPTPPDYSAMISRYDSMITQAQSAGIRPLLCSVLPNGPGTDVSPDKITTLNSMLQTEAASRGIQYVDYYTSFNTSTMLSDGTHPNSTGYAYMTGAIAPYLH